ncbi:MAG: serine/threonine-protein phosphatase, partial [Acidimicrobiia bacterium]|nr:serine/threonine-protein phosphatase [Acidimicrobiia bacterium]
IVVADLNEAELDFIDRSGLERAVECARRALDSLAEYERQRLVAIELQQGLLPETAPTVAGLDLSAHYQPGAFATRVGGDWYDVYHDDTRTVLVVGDMAGSGIRAAADMGRLRVLTKVLLQQGTTVPDVLATLNTFCSEEDLIATALAITIDTTRKTATVVSAGHLPPVIRRAATAEILTVTPGPLLGIGGTPHYPEQPLALDPDTTVAMFTDGLVEQANEPIDLSLARLASDVAEDHGEVAGLCERLVERRLVENPNDDIAVLAFRPIGQSVELHPDD